MRAEELHRKEEGKRTEDARKEEPKLGRLVANGEWERLDETSEFRGKNVEGRILTTISAVDNRIQLLEKPFFYVLRTDPSGADVILGKIKYLRNVKKALGEELVENIHRERAPRTSFVKKAA